MDHAELTPEMLLNAYANGVFPMAESAQSPEVFWVDPKLRGVFPLEQFHVSRSLARDIRKARYQIGINLDFAGTVDACAARDETWINDTIFDLYEELHALGFAHSIEVYDKTQLVGGVYGVSLGGAFFGESMFSRAANTSKIALAYLVTLLRREGFSLFDAQFLTPHLASLGAIEISRAQYHGLLETALTRKASLSGPIQPLTPQEVLQATGHKS